MSTKKTTTKNITDTCPPAAATAVSSAATALALAIATAKSSAEAAVASIVTTAAATGAAVKTAASSVAESDASAVDKEAIEVFSECVSEFCHFFTQATAYIAESIAERPWTAKPFIEVLATAEGVLAHFADSAEKVSASVIAGTSLIPALNYYRRYFNFFSDYYAALRGVRDALETNALESEGVTEPNRSFLLEMDRATLALNEMGLPLRAIYSNGSLPAYLKIRPSRRAG